MAKSHAILSFALFSIGVSIVSLGVAWYAQTLARCSKTALWQVAELQPFTSPQTDADIKQLVAEIERIERKYPWPTFFGIEVCH